MSPIRHEGEQRVWIDSWGSHVDRMIREAQARGDFENLPGAGKPLRLEDNVFAGDMQAAYTVARNANAAPLWVQLDGEIGQDTAALVAMLERTAQFLEAQASQVRQAGAASPNEPGKPSEPSQPAEAQRRRWRWWPFGRARQSSGQASASVLVPGRYRTLASVEAERERARRLYLARAADLDKKIDEYNSARPRNLTWLEKTRLLPAVAARQFDERIPRIQ